LRFGLLIKLRKKFGKLRIQKDNEPKGIRNELRTQLDQKLKIFEDPGGGENPKR
jgi:hypothetical protein